MNKLSEIFGAWVAAASPNEEQERIAKYRMSICDDCTSKAFNSALNFHYCSECGCPLSKKIFSPVKGSEACPLAKWEI